MRRQLCLAAFQSERERGVASLRAAIEASRRRHHSRASAAAHDARQRDQAACEAAARRLAAAATARARRAAEAWLHTAPPDPTEAALARIGAWREAQLAATAALAEGVPDAHEAAIESLIGAAAAWREGLLAEAREADAARRTALLSQREALAHQVFGGQLQPPSRSRECAWWVGLAIPDALCREAGGGEWSREAVAACDRVASLQRAASAAADQAAADTRPAAADRRVAAAAASAEEAVVAAGAAAALQPWKAAKLAELSELEAGRVAAAAAAGEAFARRFSAAAELERLESALADWREREAQHKRTAAELTEVRVRHRAARQWVLLLRRSAEQNTRTVADLAIGRQRLAKEAEAAAREVEAETARRFDKKGQMHARWAERSALEPNAPKRQALLEAVGAVRDAAADSAARVRAAMGRVRCGAVSGATEAMRATAKALSEAAEAAAEEEKAVEREVLLEQRAVDAKAPKRPLGQSSSTAVDGASRSRPRLGEASPAGRLPLPPPPPALPPRAPAPRPPAAAARGGFRPSNSLLGGAARGGAGGAALPRRPQDPNRAKAGAAGGRLQAGRFGLLG